MTDWHDPEIKGDSPQTVAFALLTIVARSDVPNNMPALKAAQGGSVS